METTLLKNITIQTDMMTAGQISAYVQEEIENITKNTLKKQTFLDFTQNGTVTEKICPDIDDESDNGGFYQIYNKTGEMFILGTYQTGLWYMEHGTQDVKRCDLTQVPAGYDLGTEKVAFQTSRFRSICYGDLGYLAVSYVKDSSVQRHCVYSSTDGKVWRLVRSHDSRTEAFNNSVYSRGCYLYACGSTLWKSSDLVSWESLQPGFKLGQLVYDPYGQQTYVTSVLNGKLYKVDQDEMELILVHDTEGFAGSQEWANFVCKQKIGGSEKTVILIGSSQTIIRYVVEDDEMTFQKLDSVIRGFAKFNQLYVCCTYDGYMYASIDTASWGLYSNEKSYDPTVKGVESMTVEDGRLVYVSRQLAADSAYIKYMYMLCDSAVLSQFANVKTAVKTCLSAFAEPTDTVGLEQVYGALAALYKMASA